MMTAGQRCQLKLYRPHIASQSSPGHRVSFECAFHLGFGLEHLVEAEGKTMVTAHNRLAGPEGPDFAAAGESHPEAPGQGVWEDQETGQGPDQRCASRGEDHGAESSGSTKASAASRSTPQSDGTSWRWAWNYPRYW